MIKKPITTNEETIIRGYGLEPLELSGAFLVEIDRGEWLLSEGETLPYLYIVLCGKAKVVRSLENGRSLLLSFYTGGMIGDLELMMGTDKAQNGVQAISRVKCIAIPVAANQILMRSNLDFLNRIGGSLAYKLYRSSRNSTHIILYPLQVRLCSYISISSKEDWFSENLTEVAELLGASYRHLLRELNRLTEEKVLDKQGHSYKIIDKEELQNRSKNFYNPVEESLS